MSVMVQLNNLM